MADTHFLSGNEAITVIRSRLNEPTANRWTNAELTVWLDRAARNISTIALCNMATEDVTPIADQMRYSLSNEYIKTESVNFDVGPGVSDSHKGLMRADIRAFGQLCAATAADKPLYYYIFGDNIWFWPAPNATAVAAGNVKVWGYIVVANYASDYTDVTTNALPNYLCPVAVDYAVSCAYTKIGKHSLAALNMQRYMANVSFHRNNVYGATNRVDTYDMTKVPDRTVVQAQ